MKIICKKKALWILALCFLLGLGFQIAGSRLGKGLLSQQAAQRWDQTGSSRQISLFFSDSQTITEDTILSVEYQLADTLKQDSLEAASDTARLWADAYSAKGTVTLASDLASITTSAYGVGGDYFLFHPLTLKTGGSYLTSSDSMEDRVLLDEEAAWKLFGSYDVAGQEIAIGSGSNLHIGIVAGVVESEKGYLNEKAGADSMTVYLSYSMLQEYGSCGTIQNYEIVMPNPIQDYAKSTVENLFGLEDSQVEIVDNTGRFRMANRWKLLLQFGTRSMNTKSILYPYWENTARGTEDVLLLYTILATIFWLTGGGILLVWLIGFGKGMIANRKRRNENEEK